MKLINKLFITISFIFLFGIANVSASSLEIGLGNFSSNGTNNTFYTYVTGGTTVDFRAYVYSYGGAFSNDEENTITNEKYAHLVINTCALNLTGERYVYGITNIQGNATLQGADVYASNTKCSFILDGTQYNGKYLYFYVPIKSNYVNLESVVWLNTFNLKVHFTNNTGILALGATAYTEFPSFLSDGANQSIIIDQNQTIINQNNQTNEKLDNIDDSITSEEAPTKLDNLSDSAGWLPAGPVDSILNLPLTMFQNLSNNIGSSCTPLVITLPFVDTDITLPCLNSIYEQIDGLSVWINSIGTIASAFILYSYLLKLYKWVDDTLTFRENNSIDNWGGI